MPETGTVKVAGKPLPKNVLLFGGAAAAGVVGYAYWQRSRAPTGPVTSITPDPVPIPTDTPGFDADVNNGATPATNAQWSDLAISKLVSFGIDSVAATEAIGAFLGRQRLTKVQASLVRQAIAVAGDPPVGGPWLVLEQDTGGVAPVLTAPANGVGYWRGWVGGKPMYLLRWDSVAGAAKYEVIDPDGNSHVTNTNSIENITTVKRSTQVEATVTPIDSAGNRGPTGRVSWWVGADESAPAPAPSPAPAPAPAQPPHTFGPLYVGGEGGDRYSVAMPATPGATMYRIRWELGDGSASDWMPASPPSGPYGHIGTFTWLWGRPEVHFAVRVQAGNAAGWDPNGVTTDLWSKP